MLNRTLPQDARLDKWFRSKMKKDETGCVFQAKFDRTTQQTLHI